MAVAAQHGQWQGLGEASQRLIVFLEAKSGHQGVVGGGFPVMAKVLMQGHDGVGLALDAL